MQEHYEVDVSGRLITYLLRRRRKETPCLARSQSLNSYSPQAVDGLKADYLSKYQVVEQAPLVSLSKKSLDPSKQFQKTTSALALACYRS